MMWGRRSGLFIAVCLTLHMSAIADDKQPQSYIYIQGDKETPFYVKMEGKMQPRYGKNHCIIAELAPGTVDVEVLFQQNIYPAEKFRIEVPENGIGLLLNKRDNGYVLYDLQTKKYLEPLKN